MQQRLILTVPFMDPSSIGDMTGCAEVCLLNKGEREGLNIIFSGR